METFTNDVSNAVMYYANDFNFQDYEDTQFEYICKYSIPIRSKYPKLVLDIYTKETQHTKCLKDIITHEKEETIIHNIIECINKHANHDKSDKPDNTHTKDEQQHQPTPISFMDKDLWALLYKAFNITKNNHLREKHENLVIQSVNHQMKHHVYYNYNDTDLNIQQTRRTRKKKHQPPSQIKYHREIYV